MSDKANDFFDAFKAGKMSRRELMAGAGKLGDHGGDRANFMLNAAATRAIAADFDWKKFSGTKLHLLLEQAPLRGRDDRGSRQLQDDDRHGRHL